LNCVLHANIPGTKQIHITDVFCRKNWDMPKSFPNPAVAEAYAKPRVDQSRARISHGRPDLELLRRFCSNKLGWSQVCASIQLASR